MIRSIAPWVPFVLLFATACGGGEEEPGYEWKCYARPTFGTCECYEVAVGTTPSLGAAEADEVDDCGGYEECLSYYDAQREQGRCDCGDAGFEPAVSQRRDTKDADDCPEG